MSNQPSIKKKQNMFQLEPYMIRPVIYQVFTRYLICLCLSLLWDRFLNRGTPPLPVSNAFILFAVFFAVMAWFAYLRLDGIKAPRFDRKLFRRKKRPERGFADIIDYVDEDIQDFDGLEDEEKDQCLLISNLITAAFFVITAVIRP